MTDETVRLIRNAKGLTQAEFALELNVSAATIAAVESKQRNVSDNLRIKIAQKYGGDPEVEQAIIRARAFEKLPL